MMCSSSRETCLNRFLAYRLAYWLPGVAVEPMGRSLVAYCEQDVIKKRAAESVRVVDRQLVNAR